MATKGVEKFANFTPFGKASGSERAGTLVAVVHRPLRPSRSFSKETLFSKSETKSDGAPYAKGRGKGSSEHIHQGPGEWEPSRHF